MPTDLESAKMELNSAEWRHTRALQNLADIEEEADEAYTALLAAERALEEIRDPVPVGRRDMAPA